MKNSLEDFRLKDLNMNNQNTEKSLILIVEDNQDWVNHYVEALAKEKYKISVAMRLNESLKLVRLSPDLVILDMELAEMGPRSQGLQFLDEVASPPHGPHIIVVSSTVVQLNEVSELYKKRELGGYQIFDFIHKNQYSREGLRESVRSALSDRARLISEIPTQNLTLQSFDRVNSIITEKELERLSAAEFNVFAGLVKGLPNREIAEECFIGIPTVKTHVGNILAKLQLKSRGQILPLALNLRLFQ